MRLRTIFLFIFVIFTSLVDPVRAYALTNIEESILRVEYIGLRVVSIDNEMKLPLSSEANHIKWRGPAHQSINDLDKIKKDLAALVMDQKVEALRLRLETGIDALKKVYNGIERKPIEKIEKDYINFWNEWDRYRGLLKEELNTHLALNLLKNIDEEKLKLFNDPDRMLYQKSLDLIREKKFMEANSILQKLLKSYRGHLLEGSIVSLIIDCRETVHSNLVEKGYWFDSLQLITDILNKDKYDLSLSDLFLKWRTLYQNDYYGQSSRAEIPNDEYNQRRWGIVRVMAKYLKKYPDDRWARTQMIRLIELPNIDRGSPDLPMYNTNFLNLVNLNYAE